MSEDGFTVDEDNLEVLGDRLHTLAGFLDGGNTYGGPAYAATSDLGEQAESVEGDLGGALHVPTRYDTDQSSLTAIPYQAFMDSVTNWEDFRAELATDIRTVGSMLQAAGRGYRYRDEDIAFEIEMREAPPAVPVVGEPNFTG